MKSQIVAYNTVMTAARANAGSKRAVDAPADRFVGEVLHQVVTLVRHPLRFMRGACLSNGARSQVG